jgi:protein xylosyltransferase
MTESRLLFFGRKFEAIVNQGIINQLETWLYPSRFEINYPTIDKFWMSLYHHHDLSSPTKPDDPLITLGRSLSRIASRAYISPSKSFPSINSSGVELLEMTAYNNDDTLEGILVKFSQTLLESGEQLQMEVWFKSETFIELGSTNSRTSKYQEILKDLKVGADYEQKEQIFRNFASAIGPFSEPTLAFNSNKEEPLTNLSIVWIDPRNVIQSLINVTTSESFAKPVLKSPLTPGNWSVKVMTIHHDLIYRLKFLVLPLEIYQGKSMSGSEERLVNSVAEEEEKEESLFSSQHLQQKIDDLVSKYEFT